MSEIKTPKTDPLGLERLGRVIGEASGDPSGIERIAAVYQAVMSGYTALQDRYRLLKESNRLLAEEVAWLRDQCDDFAVERSELNDRLAQAGSPADDEEEAPLQRRLEDRR